MKKIAFIATREPDYSRVSIVRSGLRNHFEVDEYVSESKSYKLRMIGIALRLVWAWLRGRLRKNECVFVGFFAQPIFPLVRFLYRGPIVADAYFSLFDTLVNDKAKAKQGSIIGRICFGLDAYMLRHAELCLTDTQQHVEYMKSAFGAESAEVKRLWISAETKPLSNHKFYPPKPGQPFHVFFWGGFIPLQGVDTIVQAANLLANENVQFTIFGAGQTYEQCFALQQELGINNVDFQGWQDASKIPEQAKRSHVALGIFGTTEKAARVIPNKAYEALAMGIPLITRASLASDELLVDGKNCMLVKEGNPQSLATKILWARDNYDDALEIARCGQLLFDSVCSPVEIGKIMQNEIRNLTTGRASSSRISRKSAATASLRKTV